MDIHAHELLLPSLEQATFACLPSSGRIQYGPSLKKAYFGRAWKPYLVPMLSSISHVAISYRGSVEKWSFILKLFPISLPAATALLRTRYYSRQSSRAYCNRVQYLTSKYFVVWEKSYYTCFVWGGPVPWRSCAGFGGWGLFAIVAPVPWSACFVSTFTDLQTISFVAISYFVAVIEPNFLREIS